MSEWTTLRYEARTGMFSGVADHVVTDGDGRSFGHTVREGSKLNVTVAFAVHGVLRFRMHKAGLTTQSWVCDRPTGERIGTLTSKWGSGAWTLDAGPAGSAHVDASLLHARPRGTITSGGHVVGTFERVSKAETGLFSRTRAWNLQVWDVHRSGLADLILGVPVALDYLERSNERSG